MTLTSIVDPALMESLEVQGFFPDTGTVQEKTITTPGGEAVEAWANLAGHINLDCNVSPLTANERSSLDKTVGTSTHKVLLTDVYASITEEMRFVSGGINYDITGVMVDSLSTNTRLLLEEIRH